MKLNVHIRESTAEDHSGILDLYPHAFPKEDLVPLVKELLADTASSLSLIGELDGDVIAHAVFTHCTLEGSEAKLSLLGPLCVAPEFHKRGVGTAIVKSGLARLIANSVSEILVLGNPDYYVRFGFRVSAEITAPYDLPEEWFSAWQVLNLAENAEVQKGRLQVTPPWQHEHLWMP